MTRKGQHAISEGSLLAFLYETLNDEEKRAVERHLLTCLRCQLIMRKLNRLKETMEREPKPAVGGTWSEELGRAEARWEMAEKERPDNLIGRFFAFLHGSLPMQAGLAAVAAMVVGLVILRGPLAPEKMTLLKASGAVTINSVSFFEKPKTVYGLGEKQELVVRDGECVFQIGDNSLIIAEKDTVMTLEGGDRLKINLIRGNVIAKVGLKPGKKTEMTIHTQRGDFLVVKAVFYIRSDEWFTECGVREGELRTVDGSSSFTVGEMAKVQINRNGEKVLAKLDGSAGEFGKLDSYLVN